VLGKVVSEGPKGSSFLFLRGERVLLRIFEH